MLIWLAKLSGNQPLNSILSRTKRWYGKVMALAHYPVLRQLEMGFGDCCAMTYQKLWQPILGKYFKQTKRWYGKVSVLSCYPRIWRQQGAGPNAYSSGWSSRYSDLKLLSLCLDWMVLIRRRSACDVGHIISLSYRMCWFDKLFCSHFTGTVSRMNKSVATRYSNRLQS